MQTSLAVTIHVPYTSLAVLGWVGQAVHRQVGPLKQAGRVVVGGWTGQSVHRQVGPLEQAGQVVVGGWAGQPVTADLFPTPHSHKLEERKLGRKRSSVEPCTHLWAKCMALLTS